MIRTILNYLRGFGAGVFDGFIIPFSFCMIPVVLGLQNVDDHAAFRQPYCMIIPVMTFGWIVGLYFLILLSVRMAGSNGWGLLGLLSGITCIFLITRTLIVCLELDEGMSPSIVQFLLLIYVVYSIGLCFQTLIVNNE
jgi:hypothetical protein